MHLVIQGSRICDFVEKAREGSAQGEEARIVITLWVFTNSLLNSLLGVSN